MVSNNAGYASVVTHGVEGLLVKPKDSDALADGLLKLLGDADLRRDMAERGRLRAEEYRWDRVSQRVLSYYQQLQYEAATEVTKPSAGSIREGV